MQKLVQNITYTMTTCWVRVSTYEAHVMIFEFFFIWGCLHFSSHLCLFWGCLHYLVNFIFKIAIYNSPCGLFNPSTSTLRTSELLPVFQQKQSKSCLKFTTNTINHTLQCTKQSLVHWWYFIICWMVIAGHRSLLKNDSTQLVIKQARWPTCTIPTLNPNVECWTMLLQLPEL